LWTSLKKFNKEGDLMREKITKDTVLAILFDDPEAVKILEKHKLPCLHCPVAQLEIGALKLGEVCSVYGIDVNKLLEELNKAKEKQQENEK